MTTISWEMQGSFSESDFRNLDPRIKSPEMVWNEVGEAHRKNSLDITNPEDVGKFMGDIVEAYAKVFNDVYNNSAENMAAYAMRRMFMNLGKIEKTGGGDMNIKDVLSNDKFFRVDKSDKWTAQPRSYNIWGKGLNTGLYGSFLEQELFGLQAGTGKEARFGDLSEALHGALSQQDIKSKSHKSGESPSSGVVDVGGVTLTIKLQKGQGAYVREAGLQHGEWNGMVDSAVKLQEKVQIAMADALDTKEISEYIIGRTLGIFKLFEKVASVLIFGVEVQKHDKDIAIFKYTSATTYARLRFDEILAEIRTNPQTSKILGAVDVKVNYINRPKEGDVVAFTKPDYMFGQLEIDVNLLSNALSPISAEHLELGTKLYKDIYNIFTKPSEKIKFFKTMYPLQQGSIATNIEIQEMRRQMRGSTTRRKYNPNSIRRKY